MSEFVTVDVAQGRLRGRRVTSSATGATYCSFQGVPYARPPLGQLRFKPPKEPESWTGTREATRVGPVSLQIDFSTGKFVGNEDCLFLNVYTSQLPVNSQRAVMVWIHGGGFAFGSGNSDVYGPDFLVAEDVVLVTINYRLGQLGFLYLDDADVTANNGLRDQIMALKWVQSNIAQFGGDPDNVTIFGESAGGFSVHFLMLSPLAAGLFHRAIAQSGSATLPKCISPREVSTKRALRLARLVGCESEDPRTVADFLRTVPAEQIVARQTEALQEQDDATNVPPFLPCDDVGPKALLPDSIEVLLQEGRFVAVPFMTGVTSAEGKVLLEEGSFKDKLLEMETNFQAHIPKDLEPIAGTQRTNKIADAIKKFYFGDDAIDDGAIMKYIDMQTDLFFVYPMYRAVQLQLRWSRNPVYVYLFDHNSSAVVNSFPIFRDDLPGAAHGGELAYLFQSSAKPNRFPPGSSDTEVHCKMVKLWTQFAKTGEPTANSGDFTWEPATRKNFNYLKISEGFHMETDMYKRRIDFLTNLYDTFQPGKVV